MDTKFNALLVTEAADKIIPQVQELNVSRLPDNDLLIKVSYSSLNFKDALSASGNKGVTKKYPHVPGIDAAGVVVQSKSPQFAVGDEVLVTGFDLGMNTWGGFGEYISVPTGWVLPLPNGLSLHESMCYGTAGFTAALSVQEVIKAGVQPGDGPVAVSGATGGVGSMAIAILAQLGYEVAAISGKSDEGFLMDILGASSIINRSDFVTAYDAKPLASPTFAAAIDTTGGAILSGLLKGTRYGGVVTCCGMVASADLHTSIFPFILRGVRLAGVDSVMVSLAQRQPLWQLLADKWKPANLNHLVQNITLHELPSKLNALLQGEAKGRYVLVHNQ